MMRSVRSGRPMNRKDISHDCLRKGVLLPVSGPSARIARCSMHANATASAIGHHPPLKEPGNNLWNKRSISPPTNNPGKRRHAYEAHEHTQKLDQLQAVLGYHFRSEELLVQACTHSSNRAEASYRQLAFVGDAALWLLFAEHAFCTYGHLEDPSSGGWFMLLSALTSRASFAATARQWGLHHYLAHSSSTSTKSSSSSTTNSCHSSRHVGCVSSTSDTLASSAVSSSTSTDDRGSGQKCNGQSRITGRSNGGWSSDALAEMFEGLVGALLLDSDYLTVSRALQPWVAEAFRGARAAAGLSHSPVSNNEYRSDGGVGDGICGSSSSRTNSNGCYRAVLSSSNSSSNSEITLLGLEQQVRGLLTWQLQQVCGYCFTNTEIIDCCSQHVVNLIINGSSSSHQAESWHFLGYSLLRYHAALQAYCENAQNAQSLQWDALDEGLRQRTDLAQGTQRGLGACQDSSFGGPDAGKELQGGLGRGDSNSGGSSGSDSGSSNLVQDMSRRVAQLTSVRHRCKMWLWAGLDPAQWCPTHSRLLLLKWNRQKQLLSRCLNVLVAAVYLDGGVEAAAHVVGVLLQGTPPTTTIKDWIPSWAQKQGSSGPAGTGPDGVFR